MRLVSVLTAVTAAAFLAPAAHAAPAAAAPTSYNVCDKADNSSTRYLSKNGYSKINAAFCAKVTTDGSSVTIQPFANADAFYWWGAWPAGAWFTDTGVRFGYPDYSPHLHAKNVSVADSSGTVISDQGRKTGSSSSGHPSIAGSPVPVEHGETYTVTFTDAYKTGGYYTVTGADSEVVETGNHTVTVTAP
ncbi:hypothetical protein [Streptomyces sp. KL118A]|uniref:hypothetical protein n=1 Tax=Streptomyces sp. KL118A TaxID=3045153 RepID=UPI00278BB085|nr:hypothetical protein [Streptomyces sp. KL118A]